MFIIGSLRVTDVAGEMRGNKLKWFGVVLKEDE